MQRTRVQYIHIAYKCSFLSSKNKTNQRMNAKHNSECLFSLTAEESHAKHRQLDHAHISKPSGSGRIPVVKTSPL